MDNKLNVKDLINVGIFTAIYFVMFFISGMTGFIPIFTILFPILLAILGGIPFILFLTKVNKFGMITIMGVLMGILTLVMGQGWIAIITGLVCGLIGDLICKAGKYKSWKHMLIGYCVFSEWVFGSMLPMWVMRDVYFERIRSGQGNAYTDMVLSLVTNEVIPIILAGIVIGALVGAFIGRAALKKHFKRAGIA